MSSVTTDPLIVAYHSVDHPMSYWQEAMEVLIPHIKIVDAQSDDAQQAQILMAWNPPEGMIAGLKSLKGVVSLAQGVDHILNGKTFPDHLKFARLIDPYMSEAMAEWIMLTVLEYHRDVAEYRAAEDRHEWIRLRPHMAEKTTVAVLGLGAIGSHVAEKLAMMNFHTIGWARSQKTIPGVTAYQGDEGLDTCLRDADIVISILPLTAETEDMFNKDSFAKMKKGAVFINAGRGKEVVEEDLIAAIDSGHLKAATLDVMRVEPLPKDHPFWDHPKIRVWPHVSAQTNAESAGKQVAKAIEDMLAGRDPDNSVNVKRGY